MIEENNISSWTITSLDPQANAYQLSVGPYHLLLDAGALRESTPWWTTLARAPDWIWLSHPHGDHVDGWSGLLRVFGPVETWSSGQTRRWMTEVVDSMIADEQSLRELVRVWPANTPKQLPLNGVSIDVTHWASGHIAGASALSLDMRVGEKFHQVLYLSDFCLHDQPLTPGAELESWRSPDTLMMETVLSDHDDITPESIEAGWSTIRTHLKQYTDRPHPQLWPVAHFGEAQEVLACFIASGVRPMIHRRLRTDVDGLESQLWDVGDTTQCHQALVANRVVVVPGAHLDKGTVAHQLIWRALSMATARVFLLNHVRAGSLARRVLDQRNKAHVSWKGQRYGRAASVEHIGVSNHAPRQDLVRAVCTLDPRTVVLVHGPKRGMNEMRRQLRKAGYKGKILRLDASSECLTLAL